MQDNQLHANLTVAEAMKVASNLKLGSHVSQAEKEEVVCSLNILSIDNKRITAATLLNGGLRMHVEFPDDIIHLYLLDSRNSRNTWSIRTSSNYDFEFERWTKKTAFYCA